MAINPYNSFLLQGIEEDAAKPSNSTNNLIDLSPSLFLGYCQVLRTAQLELETGDERKALESLHQGLSLLNSYSFHKPYAPTFS